uniref:Uncharacterized protein n=1 Tax=Aplanochytrium stocchinoi TaxID=215587 RepID=A0A7S3LRM4_9STRA
MKLKKQTNVLSNLHRSTTAPSGTGTTGAFSTVNVNNTGRLSPPALIKPVIVEKKIIEALTVKEESGMSASDTASFYTQEHSVYSPRNKSEELMYSSLWHCAGSRSLYRWGVSDKLTALHALGLMSLFIGAMARFEDDSRAQAVLSSLVTHYGIVYPEHFRRQQGKYCYPNLEMVAKAALDPTSHDIQVAARLLLQVSIERLPAHMRVAAASHWAAHLHKPRLQEHSVALHNVDGNNNQSFPKHGVHDFSSGEDSHVVMILAVMGVTHPEDLDPTTAKLVTRALTEYIAYRTPHCVAFAAELLARGYHLWFPYILDRQRLIRDLLIHAETSSTVEKTQDADDHSNKGFHRTLSVSAACQRALIEIGTKQPLDFLKTVGREAIRPDVKQDHHKRALSALAALVRKQPVALVNHLPAVVEVIIRTLDPSESALRKACLKSSTYVLLSLVKRYPMVAFQQHTQRFAVGSIDSIIIIYDLRTATKWRILEGHTSPVTALCFENNTGERIASYASHEGSVRLWQSGTAGIFATILGIKGKCIKKFQVEPVPSGIPVLKQLQNVSIHWEKRKVKLTKEDKKVVTFDI